MKNDALQSQIEDLHKKLRFYSGGKEDYTGETNEDYFSSLNNAVSMSSAVWPLTKNQLIKTPRDNKVDTWYKVELNEGEGLTVVLRPQVDKNGLYMNLCDKDGTVLSSAGASYSVIGNGHYGYVSYVATKKSTVFIRVAGEAGIYYLGFYDHYYNNASSLNDERDFFGTKNISKKISSGTMTRDDANREDWYRVDVKEGQSLTVSITPQVDKGGMYIQIVDKDGTVLSSAGASYSLISSGTKSISKKASQDCTYYVRIAGSTGKYIFNYSVNY